jgi:uncharacterized protein YdhG (YjbR/CyaY superfamily)
MHMAKAVKDVEAYIAGAPPEARKMLAEMRKAVLEAMPGAKEGINYTIPYYNLDGAVAFFGYTEKFISLHLLPDVVKANEKMLNGLEYKNATIHFPIGKPLPLGLIRKLVSYGATVKHVSKRANKNAGD